MLIQKEVKSRLKKELSRRISTENRVAPVRSEEGVIMKAGILGCSFSKLQWLTSRAFWFALFMLMLLMSDGADSSQVTCPPSDGVIEEKNVGGGAALDKLVERQEDEKGNIVELWCIDDTWFGKRYVPKTGAAVWVGKCWFDEGKNNQGKCSPDANDNGKPDEWQKISWKNVEPPGAGSLDWLYNYYCTGPNAGKLKVWETTGHWSDSEKINGKWVQKWITTKYKDYSFEDAPTNFSGIPGHMPSGIKSPKQVPGIAVGLFEINPLQLGPVWEYKISLPAIGGTGDSIDPFLGFPVDICPGDTWTLAAAGVSNPYVTGSAASAGWAVAGWGACYVSYTYAGVDTFVLDPGYAIQGFCFQSNAIPGTQHWTCYGEGLNYADTTTAPIGPTMIKMSSFSATVRNGYVEVEWTTATELNNAGFNLYRGTTIDAEKIRLNEDLIPSKGNELEGAVYSYTDYDVASGADYYYWLEDVDLSGNGTMHGPILATKNDAKTPAVFSLAQSYPNPFNPVTEIRYDLPEDSHVKLVIYNVLGQRVATLVDERQAAGRKVIRWDTRSELSSGTYFCRLQACGLTEIRKIVLLK